MMIDKLSEAKRIWEVSTPMLDEHDRQALANQLRESIGFPDDVVLGYCIHGVNLDKAFCPQGCRV